jgi:rSAM-associated Gly-rich repeat protein
MDFTTRTGLLGFLLALSALGTAPAGAVEIATNESAAIESAAGEPASIEQRLSRIAAAMRAREVDLAEDQKPVGDLQLAYGFVNRVGPRAFVNGPYRGAFRNAHPYYGGGRGFVNGGGGFVNGRYRGGSFVNAPYRGGAFRNW